MPKTDLIWYLTISFQVCLHRDVNFYVHIQLKSEAPEPSQRGKVIGVDFGRREIAKTSTDRGWDGKQIQRLRDKFAKTRASLQRHAHPRHKIYEA